MSSSTTTVASDVAGVWFSELSTVLRGKKLQVPTVSHDELQLRRHMGAAVHGKKAVVVVAEAAAKPGGSEKRTEETGGGMSDTTVYLLLDRFAPS